MTTIETTASFITLLDYLHRIDCTFQQYFVTEYPSNYQIAPGNFHSTQTDGYRYLFWAKAHDSPVIFNVQLNIANQDYFWQIKDYVARHLQHLGKSFF
jgi:hypothetical protein